MRRPTVPSVLAAGLPIVALLVGCPAPEPPVPGAFDATGPVALTVDGHPLHQEVLDLALSRVPARQLAELKESGDYTGLVEKLALGEALYHRAIAEGLPARRDVQLRIAVAARDALAQALVEDAADAAVTDDKLREAYDARKVRYARPSADVALAILADAEQAETVAAAVRGGAPLAQAVASLGGPPPPMQEVGWVPKGQLAPPIDALVFADGAPTAGALGPTQVSGRHIVAEVRSRRDSTPFDEVRDELAQELEQEAVRTFTTELQDQITIAWTPGAEGAPTDAGAPPAAGEAAE